MLFISASQTKLLFYRSQLSIVYTQHYSGETLDPHSLTVDETSLKLVDFKNIKFCCKEFLGMFD